MVRSGLAEWIQQLSLTIALTADGDSMRLVIMIDENEVRLVMLDNDPHLQNECRHQSGNAKLIAFWAIFDGPHLEDARSTIQKVKHQKARG